MAYIINVNKEMSVTVNLSQGLIQLNPQQHREISAQDLDYALQNYNSEKLGLIVVRTDKELELILNGFKPKTEVIEEVVEEVEEVAPEETEKEEVQSEDAVKVDSQEESEEVPTESEDDSNEDENVKEETAGEVTPEQKAKAKKLLIEEINAASKDGDISRLKELASDLEVKLSPNAGILNIANKLKVHVANL